MSDEQQWRTLVREDGACWVERCEADVVVTHLREELRIAAGINARMIAERDDARHELALLRSEVERYRSALEAIADDSCMVRRGWIDMEAPSRIAREALAGQPPTSEPKP